MAPGGVLGGSQSNLSQACPRASIAVHPTNPATRSLHLKNKSARTVKKGCAPSHPVTDWLDLILLIPHPLVWRLSLSNELREHLQPGGPSVGTCYVGDKEATPQLLRSERSVVLHSSNQSRLSRVASTAGASRTAGVHGEEGVQGSRFPVSLDRAKISFQEGSNGMKPQDCCRSYQHPRYLSPEPE